MRTNPPIIAGQKACLNVNCGYVHLELEIDESEGMEREKMPILDRFYLTHLSTAVLGPDLPN